MNKISFVIPCYNSEHTIKQVVEEIVDTVKNLYDFEIILVNDGSKDNVINVISEMARINKSIKVIDLVKNFGQHAALLTGLRYVGGDIAVCLDDDGQTPPSECLKLIDDIVLNDRDVVYARYNAKHHTAFRNFGSKINDLMACIMLEKPKELYLSSYFACKRIIVDEIVRYTNSYPYMAGLILRSTNKIGNVDINHRSRAVGTSGYTFGKLLSLWLNGFTAFSIKPLRAASILGFMISMFGFIYGIVLIIKKITNQVAVLGYSSLMAMMLFMGGLIMLILGLIGEYLGRIYLCINNQPQAVIRNTINI